MNKSYKQTIEDLESAIQDIESQGISIAPLNKALENLKTHSENIEAIENNINAVKSEVINPIKKELDENKRAGKFSIMGFYVGAFGLIATAISLLYTTFAPNSDQSKTFVKRVDNIENSLKELNYNLTGLNNDYEPLTNEYLIEQLEQEALLTQDSNKYIIEAYFPGEIKKNNKWYPIVSLQFFINANQIGIKGLREKVTIIDSSGASQYYPNFNSIWLSENDGFILLNKYRYIVKRIYRKNSQILTVCDDKDAVLIKRIE
ncbi:MAG: hypothetical protein JW702_11995 [Clostridiales bacterium]|nr:hypothetical protein [Clostridiales bacterium]